MMSERAQIPNLPAAQASCLGGATKQQKVGLKGEELKQPVSHRGRQRRIILN